MKIGDIVRFKSGGPLMTVESVVGPHITVIWFDTNEIYHRLTVFANVLEEGG